MSDQRRFMRWSGRLVSTPITDFWQISTTVQDPQIPNLPLESAAAPPATPDPIVTSWWTVEEGDHDDGDHGEFYSAVYEAIAQAYDLVGALAPEPEWDDEEDLGGAFQIIGENAPITGQFDVLEEEEDLGYQVFAEIRETIAAADDFVAGLFDVELDADALEDDIALFGGPLEPGAVVPPEPPTDWVPAGFWAANPYRRGRRKDEEEIEPLEATRVIQRVATKQRDRKRAERLERMLLEGSRQDLEAQISWAIERAEFLRRRDDDDIAAVLMLLS